MKNRVRVSLLWLLVGVIANIVVTNALIGVVPATPFPNTLEELRLATSGYQSSVPASFPPPLRVPYTSNWFVTHYQIQHHGPNDTKIPDDYVINVLRQGFPLRSLEARFIYIARGSSIEPPLLRHRGSVSLPPAPDWVYRYVPIYPSYLSYWPVWPGFLVNAAVYGLALAMSWRVLRRLRATRRIRRGRCASCAYELAGLQVCPECGSPVESPAEREHG